MSSLNGLTQSTSNGSTFHEAAKTYVENNFEELREEMHKHLFANKLVEWKTKSPELVQLLTADTYEAIEPLRFNQDFVNWIASNHRYRLKLASAPEDTSYTTHDIKHLIDESCVDKYGYVKIHLPVTGLWRVSGTELYVEDYRWHLQLLLPRVRESIRDQSNVRLMGFDATRRKVGIDPHTGREEVGVITRDLTFETLDVRPATFAGDTLFNIDLVVEDLGVSANISFFANGEFIASSELRYV